MTSLGKIGNEKEEPFVAESAAPFRLAVSQLVRRQVGREGEALVALVASVRPAALVAVHVLLQVLAVAKRLLALLANKRPLAGVYPLVDHQLRFRVAQLAAVEALVSDHHRGFLLLLRLSARRRYRFGRFRLAVRLHVSGQLVQTGQRFLAHDARLALSRGRLGPVRLQYVSLGRSAIHQTSYCAS